MIFALVIFFISLLGIVALFGVKYWEEQHQRVLASTFREEADERAHQLKELIAIGKVELARLPPEIIHLAHVYIHAAALQAARLARGLEAQAHRLADFVSHKHHFTRRAPQSEFLKKVSEYKNGLSSQADEPKSANTEIK